MKKMSLLISCIFLIVLLLLSGCEAPAQTVSENPFCFPDTTWMMTQEQLVKALALEEGQYEMDGLSVKVPEMECFGAQTQVVQFQFDGRSGGLTTVLLCYPDDTDMNAVKDELTVLYGESSQEHIHWTLGEYAVGTSGVLDQRGVSFRQTLTNEHSIYWDSQVMLDEYLAQNDLVFEPGDKLTPRLSRIFLENTPASFILWNDDHGEAFYTAAMGAQYKNMVVFYLRLPVSYIQEADE